MRWWPRPTATGAARTRVGYFFGVMLCAVGLHKRASIALWGYGPRGDRIIVTCVRPTCEWGQERWQR